MSFDSLLNNTAKVEKTTKTNSSGVVSNTWSTRYSSIPVRIVSGSVSSNDNEFGEYIVEPSTVYAQVSYTITDSDRLTIDSKVYEIIRVSKDSSEHHYQITVKLVE